MIDRNVGSFNLPAYEIEIEHRLYSTLLHAPDNRFGCVGEELSIEIRVRSVTLALLVIIGGEAIALIC